MRNLVFCTVTLIALILALPLLKPSQDEYSVGLISNIQGALSLRSVTLINSIADVLLFGVLYSLVIVCLASFDLTNAFFYLMLCNFSSIVTNLFKIAEMEPRPFWVSDTVRIFGECEESYGLPSLHGSISTAVLCALLLQLHEKPRSLAYSLVAILVAVIFISFMAFTRLASGAHSL
jgi:membrane-associated phospholipid phosphatase